MITIHKYRKITTKTFPIHRFLFQVHGEYRIPQMHEAFREIKKKFNLPTNTKMRYWGHPAIIECDFNNEEFVTFVLLTIDVKR